MIALLHGQREPIAGPCRRFGVVRLDLFGSAADGSFDSERSDLDFVPDFGASAPTVEQADRVLGFSEALEQMLGRRVDVRTETALRNSRFAQAIAASRTPVYDASQPTAA
jgi:hypothetical protein